jgi:hypothetical protein
VSMQGPRNLCSPGVEAGMHLNIKGLSVWVEANGLISPQ